MGRSDVAGVDPVAPENQARCPARVAGGQEAAAAPGWAVERDGPGPCGGRIQTYGEEA